MELTKIANSLAETTQLVEKQGRDFDEAENEFNQQRADTIALFHRYLGSGPYNVVKDSLVAGRLRHAYYQLTRFYRFDAGDSISESSTLKELLAKKYCRADGTVNDLWTTYQELNSMFRVPMDGRLLLQMLFEAIEESVDGADLVDTVLFCRQGNVDAGEAMRLFQLKEANYQSNKGLKIAEEKAKAAASAAAGDESKKNSSRSSSSSSATSSSSDSTKRRFDGVPDDKSNCCAYCRVFGHTLDSCWLWNKDLQPAKSQR